LYLTKRFFALSEQDISVGVCCVRVGELVFVMSDQNVYHRSSRVFGSEESEFTTCMYPTQCCQAENNEYVAYKVIGTCLHY